MCASARGEGDNDRRGIGRRENREVEETKERKKRHTGEPWRCRVERRVRRNRKGGEREGGGGETGGGWPFDKHGGPSMDVRSGPWRHTCTSPRHPGESKQPYKVAGLRFNPKFISSISKGLSRTPSVSERLTRTLPSPTSPRCSPSCLIRFSFPSHHLLLSVSCGSVGMLAGAPVHRKHTTTL